eukprot:c4258_g1_i1.p1 GENE.c4258_g1_i1~~c4258_g1_i1.p1  ORF type:complete len:438 (+),score=141.66 c4258_g1_i1:59-1315(+)
MQQTLASIVLLVCVLAPAWSLSTSPLSTTLSAEMALEVQSEITEVDTQNDPSITKDVAAIADLAVSLDNIDMLGEQVRQIMARNTNTDSIIVSNNESDLVELEKQGEKMRDSMLVGWAVTNDKSLQPDPKRRPHPPPLDTNINNLRLIVDRLEIENVNAQSVKQAQGSAFMAKRAQIRSMLSIPQQAVIERLEQRQLCDKHVKALEQLAGMVNTSVGHVMELTEVRKQQMQHHVTVTQAAKSLTQLNRHTLEKIQQLVQGEVQAEVVVNNGGYHFDPVLLRQQEPEKILHSIQDLTQSLESLMAEKLAFADGAVKDVEVAFTCHNCDVKVAALITVAAQVESELSEVRHECVMLAQAHRQLDQADREKVIALKKDLQNLDESERVRKEAEINLAQHRSDAQHTANKVIGFYQNVPKTF